MVETNNSTKNLIPYFEIFWRISFEKLRLEDEAGQLLSGLEDGLAVADHAEVVDEARARLLNVEVIHRTRLTR
jgi:hypothetical protein